MSEELKAKIADLRAQYQNESVLPPKPLIAVLQDLSTQISVMWDAIGEMNAKLNELEKTAPGYTPPRGT